MSKDNQVKKASRLHQPEDDCGDEGNFLDIKMGCSIGPTLGGGDDLNDEGKKPQRGRKRGEKSRDILVLIVLLGCVVGLGSLAAVMIFGHKTKALLQSAETSTTKRPYIPTEICDGFDNNGDGTIDEGCSCQTGDVEPCGTDLGKGVSGTKTCTAGIWETCTVGAPVETCNGLDDDGDGFIDEGVRNACGPTPTEICDGLDNNCDGFVDEDFNLASDHANCGRCGNACKPSQKCEKGLCAPKKG